MLPFNEVVEYYITHFIPIVSGYSINGTERILIAFSHRNACSFHRHAIHPAYVPVHVVGAVERYRPSRVSSSSISFDASALLSPCHRLIARHPFFGRLRGVGARLWFQLGILGDVCHGSFLPHIRGVNVGT